MYTKYNVVFFRGHYGKSSEQINQELALIRSAREENNTIKYGQMKI